MEKKIKKWLLFFIVTLFISGLTAQPVIAELKWLHQVFPFDGSIKNRMGDLLQALKETDKKYPYLFYGYDWLAFAHYVLAILFIGPCKDPVRNKWVIEFGIICCLLIIPFAIIAGHFRDIPMWWRMVDCSFGVIGLLPLSIVYNKILELEKMNKDELIINKELEYSTA